MKRLYIILPLILFFFGGTLLLHNFVSAQNAGQGLEVSPPSQEVTVDPGETKIVTAKIRNRSNDSLPMQVHVEDFTAKGDEGQVELLANSPYSISSWATVSPATFSLSPGEEKEVTATIKVPRDAAGGHFGAFVFGVKVDKPENSNTAALSQQIASLFLVRVSGPVKENLTIKEFHAPSFSEFGPVNLGIKFENTGNVHVKTYGLINVTDMFGKKVADIVVPGVNIFPQATRLVPATLNDKFLFGRYTATALMYYGSAQNESLTATTTFFVFPIRIAAGILFVIFVLFLMRKRLKKSMKAFAGK